MSPAHNPPPVADPSEPTIRLPAGSCDSHCHIFGTADRFPYAEARPFTPHGAPLELLRARHEHLGIERAVIVQSVAYRTDHAVLLNALEFDPDRYRGVALVNRATHDDDLERLNAAGVTAVRFNFATHLGDAAAEADVRAVVERVVQLGWHVQIHVMGQGIAQRADFVRSLEATVVIDHMARLELDRGGDDPAIDALFGLLERPNVWVKVSGADRVSRIGPPYRDAAALAARLVDHAPDRVVWGTDFPHVNIEGEPPDDGQLVDLLATIAPTAEQLQRLLVTNPARLYGF